MKIVTVSREFGSGGREIGKRLADMLGFAYYDREIITAIAEEAKLNEAYIERILEGSISRSYPVTFARTLSAVSTQSNNAPQLLALQHRILRELAAKGDCVIVGRSANAVLQEYRPFQLFVCADMSAKIARCRSRAEADERPTDKEQRRKIRQIDKGRADNYALVSALRWGDKKGYHLCVNTTDMNIKNIVPPLAEYARQWFAENQN